MQPELDPRLLMMFAQQAQQPGTMGVKGPNPPPVRRPPGPNIITGGLGAARSGQGAPAQIVDKGQAGGMIPAAPAAPEMPVPGVEGATPGAIERRLGNTPPSFQMRGGAPPGPSEALREFLRHQANQVGPDRALLSGPVGGIQSLLAALRAKQGNNGSVGY